MEAREFIHVSFTENGICNSVIIINGILAKKKVLSSLSQEEDPSEINDPHACGKVDVALQATRTRRSAKHFDMR